MHTDSLRVYKSVFICVSVPSFLPPTRKQTRTVVKPLTVCVLLLVIPGYRCAGVLPHFQFYLICKREYIKLYCTLSFYLYIFLGTISHSLPFPVCRCYCVYSVVLFYTILFLVRTILIFFLAIVLLARSFISMIFLYAYIIFNYYGSLIC